MEETKTRKEDEQEPARVEPPAKDALRAEVARAIEDVLWYLWQQELESYIADEPDPGDGHIFQSLVVVDGWFYGHDASPQEFVESFCTDDDKAMARRRVRSFRG